MSDERRDGMRSPDPDDRLRDVARPSAAPSASGGGGSWFRRPVTWVAVSVVVVLGLVAGVFFVLLGDEEASAGEVILEPAGDDGEDPFFESVATASVEVEAGGVEDVTGSSDGVESLSGATPGLYGGTGDDAVCDPEALVGFLEGDAEKAAAFAEVLGISPDEIADYVAGLTPVVLREDTRVTNHGFTDGRATPRQAVFQAGTAVLVDDVGVPRVRCACGNPLSEPEATSGTPTYQGAQWSTFDDARLVAVAPAPEPQTAFEVVDVDTGDTYTIPVTTGDELVLAPDGLGVVSFGQPRNEVVATLTDLLGEPTRVEEQGEYGDYYEWSYLQVIFRGVAPNSPVFVEYELRRWYYTPQGQIVSWDPDPWVAELATPEGIVMESGASVQAAYPQLYFAGAVGGNPFTPCEEPTPQEFLGFAPDGAFYNGLYYVMPQPHGLYFRLIEGDLDVAPELQSIGANSESHPSVNCVLSG